MKRSLMLLAVMAGLALATPARANVRVAVLDLEAGPGSGPTALRVSKALRRQVANTSGLSIAAGKTLAEIKLIFGCTERPRRAYHRCLAKAGTSMKADRIIVGKVRKAGARYKVVITLVDVARPLRPQTVSMRISRSQARGSALTDQVRNWVNRLFGRSKGGPGSLSFRCANDDVSVTISGSLVGTCSTSRTKISLKAGTHKVVFAKAGFLAATHVVTVSPGQTSRLTVELEKRKVDSRLPDNGGGKPDIVPKKDGKKTDKRLPFKILFFSTLASGVGLLVGSIVTGLRVNKLQDDKDKLIREIINTPGEHVPGVNNDYKNACSDTVEGTMSAQLVPICNDGRNMAILTNVLVGIGSALVATSAVFMYFAYIHKGKKESAEPATSFKGPGKSRIMVTPQIWVDGGGLSAELRF